MMSHNIFKFPQTTADGPASHAVPSAYSIPVGLRGILKILVGHVTLFFGFWFHERSHLRQLVAVAFLVIVTQVHHYLLGSHARYIHGRCNIFRLHIFLNL